MKLTDIAPIHMWLALEHKIHERSGLNAAVFDASGVRITDFKRWANRLCPIIKAKEKGQQFICAVAHQNLAGAAQRSRRPVVAECDAGLMKLVVPIFIDDIFLGVAGGCGCLLGAGEVDTFMVRQTLGMGEDVVSKLASDMPRMTSLEVQSYVDDIQREIDRLLDIQGTQSRLSG